MSSKDKLEIVSGMVEEALPGLTFRVKIQLPAGGEKIILAHPSGKMKLHRIRVLPGDRVTVEMPNLSDNRGRIVRRN